MLIARLPRRGATLAELTVVLALGGAVLGIVVAIGVKQQRLYGDAGRRLAGQEQLRHAGAILPVDIRSASPVAGDIAPGEARDTSIELRATIGTGVACDVAASSIALPAAIGSDLASFLVAPAPGDTLWMLDDSGPVESWRSFGVSALASSTTRCVGNAAPSFMPPSAAGHPRLVVETGDTTVAHFPRGTPLRFTRRVRYDVYRAGDGQWYLGYRDWNAAAGRFNQVQPASGPFAGPGAAGLGFRYFGADGVELPAGTPDVSRIALVQVTLRAIGSAMLGGARESAPRRDSAVVAIAPRNR